MKQGKEINEINQIVMSHSRANDAEYLTAFDPWSP